jgi:hypothetical protein
MGFFDIPIAVLHYEFGFMDISGPKTVSIYAEPDGIKFVFPPVGFGKKCEIIIDPKDIIDVSVDQERYRSGGKAAAGAIIGGVLTGGLGLLAGAAIGGRRRKEHRLNLVVRYKGVVCQIFFGASWSTQRAYMKFKEIASRNSGESSLDMGSVS